MRKLLKHTVNYYNCGLKGHIRIPCLQFIHQNTQNHEYYSVLTFPIPWFTYPSDFKYWGKKVSFNPTPHAFGDNITLDCIPINEISQ